MALLIFFILGYLLIISNNNLFMSNSEDVEEFNRLLLEWGSNLIFNIKNITGNAVSLDWTPE